MRVLLITDALPPVPRGGLDLHVRELQAELQERGVDVRVLAFAGSDPDNIGEVSALKRLLSGGIMSPDLRALEAEMRSFRPDAVHFHNLQGLSARLPALARKHGAQVVWTLHDFFAICPRVHLRTESGDSCDGPEGGRACVRCFPGPRGAAKMALVIASLRGRAEAIRACHQLVAPSNFLRDIFVREGFDPGRIHVLPPAVPQPPRLATLPDRDARPRFVFAGDLREAKGAHVVIEGFAMLPRGSATLEIHGGPPAPPAPREEEFEDRLLALSRGLHGEVRFFGRYQPEQLASVLDGAAALILPSVVRESFGRTANTALRMGVPVVAADHGAVPEYVSEAVNGALFEPGNAAALTAALLRICEEGRFLQTGFESWPAAPTFREHVDGLLPLYEWEAI